MDLKLDETDKAYWAGYLDGEACLRWQSGKPVIEVTSANRPQLECAECVLGGTVSEAWHRRKTKPLWRWCVRGYQARLVLSALEVYWTEKASQARLLLLMDDVGRAEADAMDVALRALKKVAYAHA